LEISEFGTWRSSADRSSTNAKSGSDMGPPFLQSHVL